VTTIAMLLLSASFLILRTLPADFNYVTFAILLFVIGACFGSFSAPNTTSIMNSLPPQFRGVGSGMRSTFQSAGNPLSLSVYFTVMVLALSASLPTSIHAGLVQNGVPEPAIAKVEELPPTGALFAVFLGYNPMGTLLPPDVLNNLQPTQKDNLLSTQFFPTTIGDSFMGALSAVFEFSALLTFLAAILSFLRGKLFIYEEAPEEHREAINRALQEQEALAAEGLG
jgi:hypothetical protein